jgi:DNA adenine methylase
VNAEGKFNVSWGKKKPDYRITDRDVLHDASNAIYRARAVIRCADFEDLLRSAGRTDVAYLDPPYFPASASSDFTGYVACGFDSIDQERVERVARAAADRGCHVVLSNADVPAARALYSDARGWKAERVEARRSVNSAGSKRGPVGELLITSKRAEQLELGGA